MLYAGHPASIDQTGAGMAKTIYNQLVGMGIREGVLVRGYHGVGADGGVLNCNLSDELLALFHQCDIDHIPPSIRFRALWVWDGAHIIELMLNHCLEDPRFKTNLLEAKTFLSSLSKFFR